MVVRPPLRRVTSDGVPELIQSNSRIARREMTWIEDLIVGSRGVFDLSLAGEIKGSFDVMGTRALDNVLPFQQQLIIGNQLAVLIPAPPQGSYFRILAAGVQNISSVSTTDDIFIAIRHTTLVTVPLVENLSQMNQFEQMAVPFKNMLLTPSWELIVGSVAPLIVNEVYDCTAAAVLLEAGEYIPEVS